MVIKRKPKQSQQLIGLPGREGLVTQFITRVKPAGNYGGQVGEGFGFIQMHF